MPLAGHLQDVFIMDAIVAMDQAEDDLPSLNDTRMYKYVIRLSDMVSADGNLL
jgi:hypothetical protein